MRDPESSRADPREPDDLPALLAEVRRARTAQHQTQGLKPARPEHMLPARKATLSALEAYASALDRHGWPVPPRMRLDIQLLRSLCGPQRPRP